MVLLKPSKLHQQTHSINHSRHSNTTTHSTMTTFKQQRTFNDGDIDDALNDDSLKQTQDDDIQTIPHSINHWRPQNPDYYCLRPWLLPQRLLPPRLLPPRQLPPRLLSPTIASPRHPNNNALPPRQQCAASPTIAPDYCPGVLPSRQLPPGPPQTAAPRTIAPECDFPTIAHHQTAPIKTTMASGLEEEFDLNQSILPEPIHLDRANPFCQNQSPCPEPIHSARTIPFCQNQSTSRNPPCPIQSTPPEPTQPSRAILESLAR